MYALEQNPAANHAQTKVKQLICVWNDKNYSINHFTVNMSLCNMDQ
jgi:hypothetical protein